MNLTGSSVYIITNYQIAYSDSRILNISFPNHIVLSFSEYLNSVPGVLIVGSERR